MLTISQCCIVLCSLLLVSGISLGSTAFIPSNPFYQLLDLANPVFPWVQLVLCCVHAIIGLFGIIICRKHSYSKTKTFSIASWAFILFAIPWDITYLVFANDLQTHAHTYCYKRKEPVDLQKILGTSLTCDEIRLAPPVVGVITILLLLLKLYFGACIIAYALRLRAEESHAEMLEEPTAAAWLDYGYNEEDIRQHYFRPGKHY